MTAHNRRLKTIEFALGSPPVQFECQVSSWNIANNTDDGERQFTYCPDGEFIEETDPDYALELTFYSDWRSGGISDFLQANDGLDAAFVLENHPDIPAEHVTWTGTARIKRPNVGGDVRTTESQEVTLRCIGEPVYTRELP